MQEAAMQTAWPSTESRSELGKHGTDGPGEGGGPGVDISRSPHPLIGKGS